LVRPPNTIPVGVPGEAVVDLAGEDTEAAGRAVAVAGTMGVAEGAGVITTGVTTGAAGKAMGRMCVAMGCAAREDMAGVTEEAGVMGEAGIVEGGAAEEM
jgi:hypothetical protein